jgi:hypothetical protein
MKAKLLLRIAAVLMLLHTIGHTIGALTWKTAPNKAVEATISSMQNNHFEFMGRQATLASFYEGYGISMIGVLLLVTVLLWLAAAETFNPLSAQLTVTLGIFLLFLAIAEYIYFFPFAALFSFLAGVCALIARFRFAK